MTSFPSKRKRQATKVVKFNVGGQPFTVSRSLLEMHPDTMLAKSASEKWQDDPESKIFIERDGELFRHVLSYLRDGKVKLPLTVTKEGFLAELQYYGVDEVCEENVDDSLIKGIQSAKGFHNGVIEMNTFCASLRKKSRYLEKEENLLRRKRGCYEFSEMCIKRWLSNVSGDLDFEFFVDKEEERTMYDITTKIYKSSNTTFEICNENLKQVGLQLQDILSEEKYYSVEVVVYDPTMTKKQILVSGAGTDAVNGIYKYAGVCDNGAKFKMNGTWENKNATFLIYRIEESYYISIVPINCRPCTDDDINFYIADIINDDTFPSNKTWRSFEMGDLPPPTVKLQLDYISDS